MATLKVKDLIYIGTDTPPTSASWEVSLDPNFETLIDSTYNDKDNVMSWTTPLPKPGGGYYSDEEVIYARVKLFFLEVETDWVEFTPGNQNLQQINIQKNDVVINTIERENSGVYN